MTDIDELLFDVRDAAGQVGSCGVAEAFARLDSRLQEDGPLPAEWDHATVRTLASIAAGKGIAAVGALSDEELADRACQVAAHLGEILTELRSRWQTDSPGDPRSHIPGQCWCQLAHSPSGAAELNRRT